jgi:hypothetical protein
LPLRPNSKREEQGTSVNRLSDKWANIGIIGIAPGQTASVNVPKPPSMIGRKALPGLTHSPNILAEPPVQSHAPSPVETTNVRHTRIPSTGNRATVMDVAQIMNEQSDDNVIPPQDSAANPDVSPIVQPLANRTSRNLAVNQVEKRRSSYEKYSSIILPPLQEETTPAVSPAGTLASNVVRQFIAASESPLQKTVSEEIQVDDLIHFGMLKVPVQNEHC